MRNYLSFLIFLSFISCNAQDNLTFIPANSEFCQSEGRIIENKEGSADYSYPGVNFTIYTNSSSIYAVIEDLSGPSKSNYYNVIIDDSITSILKVGDKKKAYKIGADLNPDKTHKITVFKRTEAAVGASRFHGFQVLNQASLTKPETKKANLLLIGDSFSCGYGNMAKHKAPPEGNPGVGFNHQNEDNYYAWGAIATRELNFSYQCVAYSGRGMYRNNTGIKTTTMPKIYDRIHPDDEKSKKWKHKLFAPDLIVIKLGTNDFMYEAFHNIKVDSSEYVDTYINFIQRLNKLHPNAQFICVAGGMMSDNWPEGALALTRIQNMIITVTEVINKELNTTQCHYLNLPTHHSVYGEDWHPTKEWHEKYAAILVKKINEIGVGN